ncbi:hypothetical protein V2G26_019351 [Clonostachys chloroleuca]
MGYKSAKAVIGQSQLTLDTEIRIRKAVVGFWVAYVDDVVEDEISVLVSSFSNAYRQLTYVREIEYKLHQQWKMPEFDISTPCRIAEKWPTYGCCMVGYPIFGGKQRWNIISYALSHEYERTTWWAPS